jgi:hypothetical protein
LKTLRFDWAGYASNTDPQTCKVLTSVDGSTPIHETTVYPNQFGNGKTIVETIEVDLSGTQYQSIQSIAFTVKHTPGSGSWRDGGAILSSRSAGDVFTLTNVGSATNRYEDVILTGLVDAVPVDTDGDGTPDITDLDDDDDGVNDSDDAFPFNDAEWDDSDGDGTGNNADLDDDNDGLADVDEAAHGTNPLVADTDGDGMSDGDELVAGTNPVLESSVLRVTALVPQSESGLLLEHPSVSARLYEVWMTTNLQGTIWWQLGSSQAGTGTNLSWSLQRDTDEGYFQIRVKQDD